MSTASPQATGEPGKELVGRLRDHSIKTAEIAQFLDALSHDERVSAIRALGAKEQSRLYDAADGFAEVRLVDLVSPLIPDLTEVRHHGKNSLPLFSHFEKRFSRPPGRDPEAPSELMGFNFQTMSPITGPGYYLAREDEDRREVLVDYNLLPDCHPDGWPEIKPNDRGLARFVYGFMIDTLRRVSEHVTIGSAARHGKDTGNWFVLCREGR
ncbi:MAG: hypothetical protein QF570_03035 [Myxococcota bacterium]|jgi:hypothetical protein|nr:hypothetical protein [Myxococcota bacterium]